MDPMTMAAIASAGASIFGSISGSRSTAKGQAEANAANLAIAREQMAFQERMDSTKYQRGVEDARKAGFNPLVAFPGSGGSPIGASAVMHNTQPNKGELYLATAKALTELSSIKADVKLKEEMAKTEGTKQEVNRAEANKARGTVGIPGVLSAPLSTAKTAASNVWNSASSWVKRTFPSTFGGKGSKPAAWAMKIAS